MKAEKTRKAVSYFRNEALLEEINAELTELEAKAAELDRREIGTKPHSTYYVYGGVLSGLCGKCRTVNCNHDKYCSGCGTKLIWESEAVDDI